MTAVVVIDEAHWSVPDPLLPRQRVAIDERIVFGVHHQQRHSYTRQQVVRGVHVPVVLLLNMAEVNRPGPT